MNILYPLLLLGLLVFLTSLIKLFAKGTHTGKQFMDCSDYPKRRYLEAISN